MVVSSELPPYGGLLWWSPLVSPPLAVSPGLPPLRWSPLVSPPTVGVPSRCRLARRSHPYLTQSVFKVVLQKSIPTQIRQRILYISNSQG